MEIKRLRSGDERELEKVSACFDFPIRPEAATRFLAAENHYILIAQEANEVAGFVSGVALTHPDKGTEMFLYELAVNEKFRNQGVGTKLVNALKDMAHQGGCYGMWVLTEQDNAAALATYNAAGGRRESTPVMLSWEFHG